MQADSPHPFLSRPSGPGLPSTIVFGALGLLLTMVSACAKAAHLNLNIEYDLRTSLFLPTQALGGNTSLTPFTVQAGDTIDLSFSFARDEYLRFDSLAGTASLEKLSVVLSLLGGNTGAGLTLTSSIMTLDVYDGEAQTNIGVTINDDCANCLELSGQANFTDSSIAIRGGSIQATVNSLTGASGQGNFDNSYWLAALGNPRLLVAREFTLDLEQFDLFPDPFNWATKAFDVDPVLLGEGDEFDFTVNFLPGQSLQGDGSVRLEEYVALVLLATTGDLQPFGSTLTDVTTELLGLQGVGANGQFTINGQDCANCLEFGGDHDISGDIFSYTGARFRGRVTQIGDTSEVGRMFFSSFLGNPSVIETPAPVPEPKTWMLSLVGLLGLMAYRRRHKLRQFALVGFHSP